MNITDYFDQIQEYIKKTVQDPTEVEGLVKELNNDNLQAVVNQDFNNKVTVEDCAEKLLKSLKISVVDDKADPNQINGDRALNTMERKLMKYSEFVNENYKSPKDQTDEEKRESFTYMILQKKPGLSKSYLDKCSIDKLKRIWSDIKDDEFDTREPARPTFEWTDWTPGIKYSHSILHDKDEVKDEDTITQFIEYNNMNPLVLDIWKYARDKFDKYPEKITKGGMVYGTPTSSKIEIEFSKDKFTLWHFMLNYIPSKHNFDNKLIRSCNFTYKDFKEMLNYGK